MSLVHWELQQKKFFVKETNVFIYLDFKLILIIMDIYEDYEEEDEEESDKEHSDNEEETLIKSMRKSIYRKL